MKPIAYFLNPMPKPWTVDIYRRGAGRRGEAGFVETVTAVGDQPAATAAVEQYLRKKGWSAEKYLFFHEIKKMNVLLYPQQTRADVARREVGRVAPITTAAPRDGVLRQDHERLIIRAAQMLDFGSPLQEVVEMLQKEGVRGDERFLIIKGAEVLRWHRQANPVKRKKIRWAGR